MREERKASELAEEEGCLDGERILVQRRKLSRVVAIARPPRRTTNCVGVELVKLLEANFDFYYSATRISNVSSFPGHGSLSMFVTLDQLEQRRMYLLFFLRKGDCFFLQTVRSLENTKSKETKDFRAVENNKQFSTNCLYQNMSTKKKGDILFARGFAYPPIISRHRG